MKSAAAALPGDTSRNVGGTIAAAAAAGPVEKMPFLETPETSESRPAATGSEAQCARSIVDRMTLFGNEDDTSSPADALSAAGSTPAAYPSRSALASAATLSPAAGSVERGARGAAGQVTATLALAQFADSSSLDVIDGVDFISSPVRLPALPQRPETEAAAPLAADSPPSPALVAARHGLTENEIAAIQYLSASTKIWNEVEMSIFYSGLRGGNDRLEPALHKLHATKSPEQIRRFSKNFLVTRSVEFQDFVRDFRGVPAPTPSPLLSTWAAERCTWDDKSVTDFLRALQQFGKDFSQISAELQGSKSVVQCKTFYFNQKRAGSRKVKDIDRYCLFRPECPVSYVGGTVTMSEHPVTTAASSAPAPASAPSPAASPVSHAATPVSGTASGRIGASKPSTKIWCVRDGSTTVKEFATVKELRAHLRCNQNKISEMRGTGSANIKGHSITYFDPRGTRAAEDKPTVSASRRPAAQAPANIPATGRSAAVTAASSSGGGGGSGNGRPIPSNCGGWLNKRVIVLWGDGLQYPGTVADYDGASRHHISYDDGDTEWIELPHEAVQVMATDHPQFHPQPRPAELEFAIPVAVPSLATVGIAAPRPTAIPMPGKVGPVTKSVWLVDHEGSPTFFESQKDASLFLGVAPGKFSLAKQSGKHLNGYVIRTTDPSLSDVDELAASDQPTPQALPHGQLTRLTPATVVGASKWWLPRATPTSQMPPSPTTVSAAVPGIGEIGRSKKTIEIWLVDVESKTKVMHFGSQKEASDFLQVGPATFSQMKTAGAPVNGFRICTQDPALQGAASHDSSMTQPWLDLPVGSPIAPKVAVSAPPIERMPSSTSKKKSGKKGCIEVWLRRVDDPSGEVLHFTSQRAACKQLNTHAASLSDAKLAGKPINGYVVLTHDPDSHAAQRGAKRAAVDRAAGGLAAKRPRSSGLADGMLDGQTMKPVGEADVAAPLQAASAALIPEMIPRNSAAATASSGFVGTEATAIDAAAAAATTAEPAPAAATSTICALDGRLIGGLRLMLTNMEDDSQIATFLRTVCNVGIVALPEKSARGTAYAFLADPVGIRTTLAKREQRLFQDKNEALRLMELALDQRDGAVGVVIADTARQLYALAAGVEYTEPPTTQAAT